MKKLLLVFLLFAFPVFAAFPTVASVTESTAAASQTLAVLMPATVNANELLLMIEANNADDTGGTITPAGWTLIFEDDDGDNNRFHIFAKNAIGNEDGTTVTITYNDAGNDTASAQVYRIQGWDGGTLTSVIEAVDAFSAVANDPPSLNPTNWGNEQTLWLEMATEDIDAMTTSSCSANYVNGVKTNDDTRAQILTCKRNNATGTEDPATFGDVAAGRQFAVTIAVRHGTSGPACTAPTLDDTLEDGTLDYGYSGTVIASGATAPYTYAVTSGALPDGVTLDADNGILNGIPTVAATFDFTITATDNTGCPGSGVYQVIVGSATPGTSMKTGHWEVRQGNIWE